MKLSRLAFSTLVVFLSAAPMLLAQEANQPGAPFYGRAMGAGLCAGLVLLGAGYGFGKIGSAALESMARQPEVADKVSGSMITIAALLEGATFFALIVGLIIVFVAK